MNQCHSEQTDNQNRIFLQHKEMMHMVEARSWSIIVYLPSPAWVAIPGGREPCPQYLARGDDIVPPINGQLFHVTDTPQAQHMACNLVLNKVCTNHHNIMLKSVCTYRVVHTEVCILDARRLLPQVIGTV